MNKETENKSNEWINDLQSADDPNIFTPDESNLTFPISSPSSYSNIEENCISSTNNNGSFISPSIFSPKYAFPQFIGNGNDSTYKNRKFDLISTNKLFTSPRLNDYNDNLYKDIKCEQFDKRPSVCNCKKSKCLKLYCECFAALRYCSDCNCVECHNLIAHDIIRQEAIKITSERNPSAFEVKIVTNDLKAIRLSALKNSIATQGYKDKKRKESPCSVVAFRQNSPNIITNVTLVQLDSKLEKKTIDLENHSIPLKKRTVILNATGNRLFQTTYPFFGSDILFPKVVAIRCLEYLSSGDLYSLSTVSKVWSLTIFDDAVWEIN
eukprot:gene24979-32548_t